MVEESNTAGITRSSRGATVLENVYKELRGEQ